MLAELIPANTSRGFVYWGSRVHLLAHPQKLLWKRERLCAAGPSLARRELERNRTARWGSDEAATCRGQRGQVALPRLPLPPTPPPVVCAGLWLQAPELGALSRFFLYPDGKPSKDVLTRVIPALATSQQLRASKQTQRAPGPKSGSAALAGPTPNLSNLRPQAPRLQPGTQ